MPGLGELHRRAGRPAPHTHRMDGNDKDQHANPIAEISR